VQALKPSESDGLFTEDLFSTLTPIGAKLPDHVLIGEETGLSFADSGVMDESASAAMKKGER
jgi:DNA repair protein RadC